MPPQTFVNNIHGWISRNRAWTAAIVAFIGTGGLLIYGNRKLNIKKRRARRAGNGARKEIVGMFALAIFLKDNSKSGTVIAGSPHEPMTRSIACDLERRGYIVFVTVTSSEEEHVVQAESRDDIRPLWLDLTTVSTTSHLAYVN
jgi:hypothetical protein